jgi:nucleoid DNA-binding protein
MAKRARSLTQSQLAGAVADSAGVPKAEVKRILDSLADVATKHLQRGESVTIPGLVKLRTTHKKATPAREMYSHLTKSTIKVKAKPARKAVSARPIKQLKDAI